MIVLTFSHAPRVPHADRCIWAGHGCGHTVMVFSGGAR